MLALLMVTGLILGPGVASPGNESAKAPAEGAKTAPKDEKLHGAIKANLKELFHASKASYEKGVLTLAYKFASKDDGLADDWRPRIGTSPREKIRWTIREEEIVIGGDPGLRISQAGAFIHKAMFLPDVDLQLDYLNPVSVSPRTYLVLGLADKKGNGFGTVFGRQGCKLKRGRPYAVEPRTPKHDVGFNVQVLMRLVSSGGVRKTYFRKVMTSDEKLSKSELDLKGHVSLFWGGNLAGTVRNLTIKGKLDPEWAKEALKEIGVEIGK